MAHPGDNAIDPDHDGYTIVEGDNCPDDFNSSQVNSDEDEAGDECDDDDDNDAVDDASDNCRTTVNGDQQDGDLDGQGDTCDSDDDGDGPVDSKDNCPVSPNPEQEDSDKDGKGDACDEAPPTAAAGTGTPGGGALARVAVARTHPLQQFLGGGLAVAVQCSAACGIATELVADAASARRLGLGSRRTLAKATWTLGGAARTWVFLEPNRRIRARLRGGRRVTGVIQTTVTGKAGGPRSIVRRVTLR